MIEATFNEIAAAAIPIAMGIAGVAYGLIKRIELNEAISLIDTIREVTHPTSEGGETITIDEKIRIADEVIEILKK